MSLPAKNHTLYLFYFSNHSAFIEVIKGRYPLPRKSLPTNKRMYTNCSLIILVEPINERHMIQ